MKPYTSKGKLETQLSVVLIDYQGNKQADIQQLGWFILITII
ncbi:hypothetical protein [Pseudoalteromonas holothuriae]|nr:hypothetical protein [Pseudoalteromonas sp. CIP111854]